jgi:signal transduction histidine kinase
LGIAYTFGNIGLVHAELAQNDSAEFYIHKATEILEALGDRYPIAVYQTYMADIYRDKQEWERAFEYAHNSLKISEEDGLKEQIRDASLKLSELYHDIGEFEKAYDYQSQYIAFRDSINNEDVIRKMADLRTEYEVSKKQTEVDLLEQRRENERWVMFSLASVLGFISVVAFFTFRNNLARKKTNVLLSAQKNKIEIQNDKLEGLVKMKDKFFGIISHDLRSPVNSLNGIAQLLKHYVKTKNTDEIEQLSGLIDKSVENLSVLLDNLLNWALSQQGALPYDPKNIPFNPLISNVVEVFKNAALAKSIEIIVEVEEGLRIFADEDSVHALLRNILNNSLKFTTVNGRIEIMAKSGPNCVEINITDNGIGMNDYQLRNLFKVNKKKVNKGTMGEKGSGLGMLLCKEIVKLNKGKINAESEQGGGTKIILELPAGN